MKTFAVCELEEHLKEILRLVQENKETIEVTNAGEVVALLVPTINRSQWIGDDMRSNKETIHVTTGSEVVAVLEPVSTKPLWLREKPEGDMWASYDRLVAELGIRWPEGVNAVDLIRDMRGEW